MQEIDFEKSHLVIYKDVNGKFRRFEWYPEEFTSKEILEAKILGYNERFAEKLEGQDATVELITDQLIREICAYKQHGKLYESIIRDAKDVQESIDKAVDILENAVSDLNRIRGLD
jgi:hypothetical protein